MTACAILAVIALVTGPNSTQLYLVKFMPVTRAINGTHSHAISIINSMAASAIWH